VAAQKRETRHLWYKSAKTQHADRASRSPTPTSRQTQATPQDKQRLRRSRTPAIRRSPPICGGRGPYSIGTASRPINLATSSKWSGIVLRDGLCKRTRHSYRSSRGCLEGRRRWPYRKVRTSGIESLLANPASSIVRCEYVFWAQSAAQRGAGSPASAARSHFSCRQKRQQVLAAPGSFAIGH